MVRLFLIRHGETVDNVAGVYAGRTDSPLTSHGVSQTELLGRYFNARAVIFTHIFSSNLQRAYKTAELIREAQPCLEAPSTGQSQPQTIRLSALAEQDFGFYEGKPFYARPRDVNKTGKQAHHDAHHADPGFVDVESKESMAKRMDEFLDEHLLPLFNGNMHSSEAVVAIVSHGIILSVLWRRLLLRLPAKSVKLPPELLARRKVVTLEHLGGWSNTGYLEVHISKLSVEVAPVASKEIIKEDTPIPADMAPAPGVSGSRVYSSTVATKLGLQKEKSQLGNEAATSMQVASQSTLAGWSCTIKVINGKEHLKGLKRTRGGVGSAKHDEGQTTITSFFKRRKVVAEREVTSSKSP